MDLKRILTYGGPQNQQQAITPVRPKDQVAFSCRLCGDCCRHVEDRIMLEPLDAYRLARHLRDHGGVEDIEEVYGKYTHPIMLEELYPVFLLNTQGEDHACVFLKDGRCGVYESRPRICRLYPFTVENGERGRRFAYYKCLDRHASHFEGGRIIVDEWMYRSFTRDARDFVEAETATLPELGKLLRELGPDGRRHFLIRLLYYRYYNYDLDKPFLTQYQENQQALMEAMRRKLNKGV